MNVTNILDEVRKREIAGRNRKNLTRWKLRYEEFTLMKEYEGFERNAYSLMTARGSYI